MDGEDCVNNITSLLQTIMIGILSLLSQPPVITSCYPIIGYTLSVVDNVSQQVHSSKADGEGTPLSIIISNISTYYNITVYAITNCGTITTSKGTFSELTVMHTVKLRNSHTILNTYHYFLIQLFGMITSVRHLHHLQQHCGIHLTKVSNQSCTLIS